MTSGDLHSPSIMGVVFFSLDDVIATVDRLLARYEGTHNYHNFTSGKKFKDMSSNRYIMSFKVFSP